MFIRTMTAHDEQQVMVNTNHIVLITYYPESNMSRIDTTMLENPVWVDGNFIDTINNMEVLT